MGKRFGIPICRGRRVFTADRTIGAATPDHQRHRRIRVRPARDGRHASAVSATDVIRNALRDDAGGRIGNGDSASELLTGAS